MDSKKKDYEIIVNAQEKIWSEKEISYKEVVVLAFGSYSEDPNVVYTVIYSRGDKPHQEGSLVKGKSVKVKNGMIFNVSQTNKS
jgi:Multiubiquitin